MRALPVVMLLVLAPMALAPLAAADWGMHYGAFTHECPRESLGVALAALPSCPHAYHGGWVEQGGCEADVCALRLWHSASSYRYEPQAAEVRSVLVAGSERVLLCSATGENAACGVADMRASFELADGCVDARILTFARDEGAPLASVAETTFLLCREDGDVWFGDRSTHSGVADGEWGCPGPQVLLAGCYQGVGAVVGAEACDETTCQLVAQGWGVMEGNAPGARTLIVTITTPSATSVVCADAGARDFAYCSGLARWSAPLAIGDCTDAIVALRGLQPSGAVTIELPFRLCREESGWIDAQR